MLLVNLDSWSSGVSPRNRWPCHLDTHHVLRHRATAVGCSVHPLKRQPSGQRKDHSIRVSRSSRTALERTSGAVGYAAAWRKGEQWKCHKIHMGYQKPMLPSAQPLPEHWKRPPIDVTPLDGRRPYGRPGSDPDANRVNFPGFADRYGRKVFPRSPTRSTGTAGGHDRSRTQYQSEQAPCLTQCSPWSGPDGRPRRPDGILAVSSKLWTDCTGIVRPVRDVWRSALR